MNIPKASIQRGPALIVAVILIVIWGVLGYRDIPKREYPEVDFPACNIITVWPGASPEKVEQLISEKIEDAAGKAENIEKTVSWSRTGISIVFAYVDTDKLFLDKQEIWDEVKEEVDRVRDEMPEGIYFGPFVNDRFSEVKSMLISLSSDERSYPELIDYAESLSDELTYLDTVNRSEISGNTREVIYLISNERFNEYGVHLLDVMRALSARNITMSGGILSLSGNEMIIEPSGEFNSLDEIGDVVINVSPETGHTVYLRDLFTIRRGLEDPPDQMAHVSGKRAVLVDVELKKGENVIRLGEQVEGMLERARITFPPDVNINVVVSQAEVVSEKLSEFSKNLYQGIVLVLAVALLSIGIRPAVIMAVAIPLSLLFTFGFLPVLGRDMENMVITGLIVALGMIVDNAVVITENIDRYMQMGYDKIRAAWTGTGEVAIPMLSATATTIAAFGPLAFIPGTVGEFIVSIPLVVIIALSASYAIAITVTPWMCSRILVARQVQQQPEKSTMDEQLPGLWGRVGRVYDTLIGISLKQPKLVIMTALLVFIVALVLIPRLGMQFFPNAQKDLFLIEVWAPEGTNVNKTREIAAQVEDILQKEKKIKTFVTYTGIGSPRIELGIIQQNLTPNYAMIWVKTHDWRETNDLVPQIRDKIRRSVVGARVEAKLLETGPPVGAPVSIEIQGEDIDILRSLSEQVQQLIAGQAGVFAIHDDFGTYAYKISGDFDEDEIKRIGLTNQEIALSLMAGFSGLHVTDFREDDKTIPIKLKSADYLIDDFTDLAETRVRSSLSKKEIALKQVTKINARPYVPVIRHKNGKRTLKVNAFVEEGVLADNILKNIWPGIEKLEIPEGYHLKKAGEFEEREKAFGRISRAFMNAILLMLLVLMINFNSVKKTLIIFSTIPLSLVGSVTGLFVTGNPFGFMAFLGVVALSGIVVNNAIILIDFIDHGIADGVRPIAAIKNAGRLRMRPIFVTTATTMGGMLPLALGGGPLFAPMAWVIIFGLAASTVLTLIVVPNLYFVLIGKKLENESEV